MSEFQVRPDWMAFCLPDISEAEVQADADVIRSGWWAKGPRTMEFQKKFAEYVGAKHCIAVNSCTAALHLALLTQNIGPGDEVITTPLTFASTANTILHVGATPVFADIDPNTGLIDPAEIEKKVTPRTRAVVPVLIPVWRRDLGADRANLRCAQSVFERGCGARGRNALQRRTHRPSSARRGELFLLCDQESGLRRGRRAGDG